MKDIKKAIAIRDEYWKCKNNGFTPYILSEKLKECGFESIDEFVEEKRLYLFNNLEFHAVYDVILNGVTQVFEMIKNGKPGALLVDWDDTYILAGEAGMKTVNQTYCKENNIEIFPIHTGGGTIVGSKEDFSLGICTPENLNIDDTLLLNQIKGIIQKYTNSVVSVEGNDILIDGKKICGSAHYDTDTVNMFVMHISFSNKLELISKICNPDKIGKSVGHLDCMTKEQFKEEVAKWLRL